MSATNYIADLVASGRYHFTTKEAVKAIGSSIEATRAALRRLMKKGEIASPFRGFYLVVAPEYRRLGCLPADQFIPQLMDHLGLRYYVALLSAARYYGAAHQQPLSFQVMVQNNRPPIICGEVRVAFVARRNIDKIPTSLFSTSRGYFDVSSPEATAFDLVGYPSHSGGIDNVATLLTELSESIDPGKLRTVASLSPVSWVQRLGYLLALVGATSCALPLEEYVYQRATIAVPLIPGDDNSKAPHDSRWKLLVNTDVEPDL